MSFTFYELYIPYSILPHKKFGYVDALSRLPKGFDDVFDKSQISEEHQVNGVYAESSESLPISLAKSQTLHQKTKTWSW